MIEYSSDDISEQAIINAYRWSSFNPEKRVEYAQRRYMDDMQQAANAVRDALDGTQECRDFARTELQAYKQRYIAAFNKYLSAESRTASAMVTGPAKFDFERNHKRQGIAIKRWDEFTAVRDRGLQAIVRKVKDFNRIIPEGVITVLYDKDGVRVEDNAETDRIMIIFDGKPDNEMIAKLRKSAWK